MVQNDLDVITSDECCISFFTMKYEASDMVRLAEDDPDPEVPKTAFQSQKRIFTIFFNSQGLVPLDTLPEKATITAKYYTETV